MDAPYTYVIVEMNDGDLNIATYSSLKSALRKASRWIEEYMNECGSAIWEDLDLAKKTRSMYPHGSRRQITLYEDDSYSVTIRACTLRK